MDMRFTKETYKLYSPLVVVDKQIRLVIIAPRNANPQDNMPHVSIDYTSLADPQHTRFEALSYCWGDAMDSKPIMMTDSRRSENFQVMISGNLQRALLRLRRLDTPRTCWIDLLSINQCDSVERAEQVALMGEIYSAAESVRVWLGELEEIPLTERDLQVLTRISKAYPPELGPAGSSTERQVLNPSETHVGFFENGIYIANMYFPDRPFMRQWFQRVWVLQEVWSASSALESAPGKRQHSVSVVCGDIELPWWAIMHANLCLYCKNRQRRGDLMPSAGTELFTADVQSHNPQRIGQPAARRDILTVVTCGLGMRAMDPRDRIFALLAFGKDTHNISDLPLLIRPNYTKSVAEVYADFTVWWIQEHKSLRILSVVHALQGRTWVNLHSHTGLAESNDRPSWTLWCNGDYSWVLATLGVNDYGYKACGDRTIDTGLLTSTPPPNTDMPAWRVPAFRGIRIDTIAALDVFPIPRQPSPTATAYFRIFDSAGYQWLWRTYTHDADRGEAGGRTFRS
jgi:hypothetical protein